MRVARMAVVVLAFLLSLAGCTVTQFPSHSHTGVVMELTCKGCAQGVRAVALSTLREAIKPRPPAKVKAADPARAGAKAGALAGAKAKAKKPGGPK